MSSDKPHLHLHANTDPMATFASLSRRLRDNRQPITPALRESLASIIDSLAIIHQQQQLLIRHFPISNENKSAGPDDTAG